MICFAKTTVTESRSEVERLSAVREKVNFLGCFDYGGKIVAVARKKEIYVEWLGHINKQGYYNDRPAN